MARLILRLVAIALLPVLLAVALVCFILEDQPLAVPRPPPDYQTVAEGKAMLKRIKQEVEAAEGGGATVAISVQELRHLAVLASHTFAPLAADVELDNAGVHAGITVKLPPNPGGDYLNVSLLIAQSDQGIDLGQLSLGPLQMPGARLLPWAARIVDGVLQDNHASDLLQSVHSLQVVGDTVLLGVSPSVDTKSRLKQSVRKLQAWRWPSGEQQRVLHYYDLLARLRMSHAQTGVSLDAYIAPLLAEAAVRSTTVSAVAENRSAIWALAIFFSSGQLEALTGKLVSDVRPLATAPANVTLAGRSDLMLHFIYSAGISLATQQGIGVAAGEFKELLDSGDGGGGFSFADLAADRAGIAFVTMATGSESTARDLQQRLAEWPGEASYFPFVDDLAEGLGDDQFRQEFGSIESPLYRRQVALIDQRIAGLPAYQSSGNAR